MKSAYAKFRYGMAPDTIELCRYGLVRIPTEEKVCNHRDEMEDKMKGIMLYIKEHKEHKILLYNIKQTEVNIALKR